MKLKKILKDLDVMLVKGSKEQEITGMTADSRVVAPGNLFVAKRGDKYDGNDFIEDAIRAGAYAILTDIFNPFLEGVTQIIAKDVDAIEPLIAKQFYQDPSSKLEMVGITGTNGKTTTSYLIKHLLEINGPTGLIGTIERIIGDYRTPSDLTTPDCITTHKLLHEMVLSSLSYACMEVSSHALDQKRVYPLLYDVALFTNLSPEHLDYHKEIDAYAAAKARLFSPLYMKKGGVAVVNYDSPWKREILADCRNRTVFYGMKEGADYLASNIIYELSGTTFTLTHKEKNYRIKTALVGAYNVYNVLGSIAVAHELGIGLEEIQKRLLTFVSVKGRLEKVPNQKGIHIFVDFAHTDDALKNVLETLSQLKTGKLITVFGCGGNRDREKRPRMAREAEKYSDFVVVTSDNPRNEDPDLILEEIRQGFTKETYTICPDRKEAILLAMQKLSKGDILLIAGKGHELLQIQKLKRVEFDDVKVAEEIANRLT